MEKDKKVVEIFIKKDRIYKFSLIEVPRYLVYEL